MRTLHLSPQRKNPPAVTSGLSDSLAAQAKGHSDDANLHDRAV